MGRDRKGFKKGDRIRANVDIGSIVMKGEWYVVFDYLGKDVGNESGRKDEFPLVGIKVPISSPFCRKKYISCSFFTPEFKVREENINFILKGK